MNIYVVIQVIKYKEVDAIQVFLKHLQFSNVSTDTAVILKDKKLNWKVYITV